MSGFRSSVQAGSRTGTGALSPSPAYTVARKKGLGSGRAFAELGTLCVQRASDPKACRCMSMMGGRDGAAWDSAGAGRSSRRDRRERRMGPQSGGTGSLPRRWGPYRQALTLRSTGSPVRVLASSSYETTCSTTLSLLGWDPTQFRRRIWRSAEEVGGETYREVPCWTQRPRSVQPVALAFGSQATD